MSADSVRVRTAICCALQACLFGRVGQSIQAILRISQGQALADRQLASKRLVMAALTSANREPPYSSAKISQTLGSSSSVWGSFMPQPSPSSQLSSLMPFPLPFAFTLAFSFAYLYLCLVLSPPRRARPQEQLGGGGGGGRGSPCQHHCLIRCSCRSANIRKSKIDNIKCGSVASGTEALVLSCR